MSTGMQRQKERSAGTVGTTINQKSALSAAYAELGKELASGKLKSIGSYTLGKIIGEGTFGKVRLGTHRLTGVRVAIKQVPKAHSASLTREIHHHRRLHHPNVMQLYEVMATESYIWMVTELCAGGELYDYLVERSIMPEPEARRIFGQLCLAVAYVHDRDIVHRDIKLENVLLDERCNVKLGDFGFTREYEAKKLMETFCGTTGYAAPEMLAGRKYTGQEVDIWSLGVILYALLCGALPFDDDNDNVMKEKIMKGEFELPVDLSEESRQLVTEILQQDPSDRPSIRRILDHPWFHKIMITTPMSTVEEDENEVSQNGSFFRDEKDVSETPGNIEKQEVETPTAAATSSLVKQEPTSREHTHMASGSTFSEASFFSAKSKSDSESSDRQSSQTETTEPTTEKGDEEIHDVVPYLNPAGRGTLALHRNESQSTIRREGSSGSDASKKASTAVASSSKAASSLLATHHEAPTSLEQRRPEEGGGATGPLSVPLENRGSQSSSRSHHRTPSRTKRVSSGSLSEPIPPTLDFRPTNFVALLEQCSPAMFSTIIEQNILHQLSSLGMDVGQIVHSVINEACDASGAMWWILKKKAEERHQADTMYSPLPSSMSLAPPPPPLPPKDGSKDWQSADTMNMPEYGNTLTPVKNIIRPAPIVASQALLGLVPSTSSTTGLKEETKVDRRGTSPSTSIGESPSQSPIKPIRPAERHRASSLSVRLSNALSGKDKENKKEVADSVFVGEEQLDFADRSKSPVGALLSKMSGNSPSATPKSEKEKEKKKESAKSNQISKIKEADDESNDRTSPSSRSSPMRSNEESGDRLAPSKSMDTFSTLSSSTQESTTFGSPAKSKVRPSFLSTFRTWFEDKDKSGNAKKKRQQQRSIKATANGTTPHIAHSPATHSLSRNGSIRRTSTAGLYSTSANGSTAKRSPRQTMPHRGSLSRRSSSGSGHYPHNSMTSPRPKASRRQSAGSITPTATSLNVDDLAYALQYPHRVSRPSSAQSLQRPLASGTGLHGKSGSASSSSSIFRQQQSTLTGYNNSGSLRNAQGRRSSLDGGTTVRRHQRYVSPHHIARSDSGHSRPSTPSKLREGYNGTEDGLDALALNLSTPRRSFDSEGNHGRISPLQISRPSHSQSVFVAHKSRTPYKPPSSNTSLHRQDRDMHDKNEKKESHVRAWRRSWGKPPPFWVGPVDNEPTTSLDVARIKPKLRNVFANKELDDEWEDEEEEPMYAGGLGQLDSSASHLWSNQPSTTSSDGSQDWNLNSNPIRRDGMPGHIFGANRYAGVRSIFQPPTLGRETTPKAWTTSDGTETVSVEEKKEAGGATKDAATASSSSSSRVRAGAPAFKGADILEEDEEEEEEEE